MRVLRRVRFLGVAILLLLALGIAADAQAPRKGGVLRIGNLGEPPTLDAHWTTATLTEVLTNHLYEGLYALDEGYRPIPMLAEGLPTVSQDGLTYAIRLRQGIKFHNGKEMTSDDVVASLQRWTQQSQYGKALAAVLAEMRATGKYAIELKLKQKSAAVVVSLAAPNNFGAIYPKEIAEKFPPAEKVTEFVGTGPFKLAEWKPDQYIRMVRFDDYKSRSEAASGYGGAKVAYVDEIRWIPVPDVATRVAQMETGRARVRRRPEHRRLRPAAEERPGPADHGQAVLLARRGLQQEGRPDDEPEAPPGLAGGARHGDDHEGRGRRPVGVLPDGRQPGVRREQAVVGEAAAEPGAGTSTTRRRRSDCSRKRGTRASRSGSWRPRSTSGATTSPSSRSSSWRTWGSTSTSRWWTGRPW